jgi:hypothetical protein
MTTQEQLTPLEEAIKLIDNESKLAEVLSELSWLVYEGVPLTAEKIAEGIGDMYSKPTEEEAVKIANLLLGAIYVKDTESWGGGEGERYNYVIFYIPQYNEYVCAQGWYESNNGTEYDTVYVVEPRDIIKTSWSGVCESDKFDLQEVLKKANK